MVFGQVAFPEGGSLVVAFDAFGGAALEDGSIEVGRIEVENINKIFPCPVNGFLLKIVAKRPVAKHLEHGVVVGVVPNLFQVVVLAAGAETFLGICHTAVLWNGIAENDVLELVHARIGEHERGVVLDDHRC